MGNSISETLSGVLGWAGPGVPWARSAGAAAVPAITASDSAVAERIEAVRGREDFCSIVVIFETLRSPGEVAETTK